MQHLIAAVGPNDAVTRLFASDHDSAILLRGIASGSTAWLRVAVRLAPGLDAHPREEVLSRLGVALRHHSDRVLFVAPEAFSIAEICGAPDVDEYEHLAPALSELRARQTSVRAVTSRKVSRPREECLAALAAAEKPLRAFFVNP
ncbi:MAG TPA: hypothetical protein VNN08_04920 [Thermoanaerobaculia bacterium]|nr:hypothetical protein [Thermoanaerobaculia bacterium]